MWRTGALRTTRLPSCAAALSDEQLAAPDEPAVLRAALAADPALDRADVARVAKAGDLGEHVQHRYLGRDAAERGVEEQVDQVDPRLRVRSVGPHPRVGRLVVVLRRLAPGPRRLDRNLGGERVKLGHDHRQVDDPGGSRRRRVAGVVGDVPAAVDVGALKILIRGVGGDAEILGQVQGVVLRRADELPADLDHLSAARASSSAFVRRPGRAPPAPPPSGPTPPASGRRTDRRGRRPRRRRRPCAPPASSGASWPAWAAWSSPPRPRRRAAAPRSRSRPRRRETAAG